MHACDAPTLATSEPENCIKSACVKWPKFLGKGTYGSVWKIDEENVKKSTRIFDEKNNNDIISPTLKEVCFLSTFDHSHIRSLTRVDRQKNLSHIDLIMPDAGVTLSEWAKKTPRDLRVYGIPYIIIQLLSALTFLEKHGISHGDLKPWNILISENFHVSIIDWGGVCLIPLFFQDRACTEEFAAPELMESPARNGCPADIFSLGLIIRYLVYGGYESLDWITHQCSSRGFVPILKSADMIRQQKGIDLIKRFQSLLSADPSKRPKASEIMEWKELSTYRRYLRQDEISENVNYNIIQIEPEDWKRFTNITLQDRKTTIIWFFEGVSKVYPLQFLPFAIELMDQYIVRKAPSDLVKRRLCLILLACFSISNGLLSNSIYHSDLIFSKDNPSIHDQLREEIFNILSGMDWNIYFPIWNKDILHPNLEVMLHVLTDDGMFGANQDKKLALYEKLKSEKPTSSLHTPKVESDSNKSEDGKREVENNA